MPAPAIHSLLLGSHDAEALRRWYEEVLGAERDPDGFLHFGPVAVLIDQRDDVEQVAMEPGRVILNYTVSNIAATARALDAVGVTWVAPVEYRENGGAWFGTICDPEGNYVQLIQLTSDYWRQRRGGPPGAPPPPAAPPGGAGAGCPPPPAPHPGGAPSPPPPRPGA